MDRDRQSCVKSMFLTGRQSRHDSRRSRLRRSRRRKMTLLLLLHVANSILPSFGDLRSVNLEEVSTLWRDDDSIWWPLLRIVFRKAKTVQVVRLPTSGTLGYSLWTDLVPKVQRRLNTSVIVWNASSQDVIHDIRHLNPPTKQVRTFVLLVGSDYLGYLTDSRIWYAHTKYIILVEQSDRCSENFNFLFHRQSYLAPDVFFVLSACPEFAYIVKADEPNSSVVLDVNNITSVLSRWNGDAPPSQNSTLKVAMFYRFPTSVIAEDSKQKWTNFEGIDGFFLENLCDYYGFRPSVIIPNDGHTYGSYDNGTATGTLGMVLRGEADIAMNGRFLIDYGTREISLTIPYLTDMLCVMVPRASKVPSYIAMFRCFDELTWMSQLLAFIVGSFVWTFIVRSSDKKRRHNSSVLIDVYFLLLAGLFTNSTSRTHSARIFITSCLIFSVIFMGAFQGLLFKSMTSPAYYPELDTLDDVDRSGLPVVTASPSLINAFPADDEDPLIQRLRSKLYVIRDKKTWNIIQGDDSNYASLWRKNSAFLRLHKRNGSLHLVNECPRFHFLSFLTQKQSPYRLLVNRFITLCTEHGLMQLWRERTFKFTATDMRYLLAQGVERDLTVELSQVEPAFFLLAVGLAGSVLAFVYETIRMRRKAGRRVVPSTSKRRSRYVSRRLKRFVTRKLSFRRQRHLHIPFRQ